MQLISVTSKPIVLETTVQNAKLEVHYHGPKLNIERKRNGMSIQTKPARLVIDNTDFFESLGHYTNSSFSRIIAQRARQSVMESIERFASEGNMMLDYGPSSLPMIIDQRMQSRLEVRTEEGFIPARVKIRWEPHELNIDFVPDELEFNWEIGKPENHYTAFNVQTNVKQWHSIEISYLGTPNYFPASSAPGV